MVFKKQIQNIFIFGLLFLRNKDKYIPLKRGREIHVELIPQRIYKNFTKKNLVPIS